MTHEDMLRPISDYDSIWVPELSRNMTRIAIDRHKRRAKRLADLPAEFVALDESGGFNRQAMVFGGVFCAHPFEAMKDIAEIRERYASRYRSDREVKFSDKHKGRLEPGLALIDYFFANPDLRFGTMIVAKDQQSTRYFTDNTLDLPASERAYTYYVDQLLEKRLTRGHACIAFIDERPESVGSGLTHQLEWWGHEVLWATLHNSRDNSLIQLADVLTGVVAADYNGPPSAVGLQFQQRVKNHLRINRFEGNLWAPKFNVWKFRAPADHLIA